MSDCTSTGMDEFGFRIEAVKHLNEVASALSGETEIERLKSENAALRADKERMDWCDKNLSGLTLLGKSMREYVDAARKEQS